MKLRNRKSEGQGKDPGRIMLSILVLLLAVILLPFKPAYAAGEEPDTVSLDDIIIFHDLLEEDDFLAFVPYEISFTDSPDESIDETFIFRILNPSGSTELGTTLATPFYNSGYGIGIVSFYISSNITTGEAYIFRVQENPAYYADPQFWDFVIDASNYSESSDQEAALKATVVNSATSLTTEFGVQLLSTSEAGLTVLSTYGELYYLDAIPGLQSMCPSLFGVQIEIPDYTKRSWSYTFAETLQTKYSGTFIYDFMTGFAGLFSIETSPAMNFLSIVIFVIVITISVWKFKATMLSAILDGYTFLLLMMLMGFFSMIWAGFIAFISMVIGGAILLFKRA